MRAFTPRVVACALIGLLGCSLVIDTSDLTANCPSGQKLCGEAGCVAETDPAFGCGPSHCDPCPFMHGIPACDGSECTTSRCLDGFGCDKCRNNLFTDEFNCGKCGHKCGIGELCSLGECVQVASLVP